MYQLSKIFVLACALCILYSPSQAQQGKIDSLRNELSACNTDVTCVDQMLGLGNLYRRTQPDSAQYWYEQALERADDALLLRGRALLAMGKHRYRVQRDSVVLIYIKEAEVYFRETEALSYLSDALLYEARYYGHFGPVEKAITLMKEAVVLADSAGNNYIAAIAHSNMGVLFYQQGRFPEAVENMVASVDYRRKGNLPVSSGLLLNIGATHIQDENYEQAIYYYRQGLEVSLKQDNKSVTRIAYQNIGAAYTKLIMLDSAIANLDRAQVINIELNDSSGISTYHTSIGDILKLQSDLDKVIVSYQKAKATLPSSAPAWQRMFASLNLANAHLDKSAGSDKTQLELAIKHAQQAYQLASEANLTKNKGEAAGVLYRALRGLNQPKAALQYVDEYLAMRDSLLSEERIQALADVQARYEAERKELEIEFLSQQNETKAENLEQAKALQTNQQWIIALMGIAIIGTGLLLQWNYRIYLQKKKANTELSAKNEIIGKQNEDKEILLKEIHHRVKNNLQVVSSLLDLQSGSVEDESVLLALEDGQSRVKAMALIHQKLYQNENIGNISFQEYAQQLCSNLASIYSPKKGPKKGVRVVVDGGDASLDIDTAIPLGLILNELVSNAFKYAFVQAEEGQLNVQLKEKQPGTFEMTVRDTGPGLPADFNLAKARSLGLRLVRRLSKQLYGSSTYHFDGGAQFLVTFKETGPRKVVS